MPPRLELMIMRTLQLSYVQARDLVQEGRDKLNMKYSDPWTEELKTECELIHKARLECGFYQQQIIPLVQSNDKSDAKEEKNDATENENEDRSPSRSNLKDDLVKANKTNESNNHNNIDEEHNDDDVSIGDDDRSMSSTELELEHDNRRIMVRMPSRKSLCNEYDESMWVQTGYLASVTDSMRSTDRDRDDNADGDDDDGESLMHQCLKIKTRKSQESDDGMNDYSNHDANHDDTRNASRQPGIPKYVYVITLNEVPIEFAIEEAKKKNLKLRSSQTPVSPGVQTPKRRTYSFGKKHEPNDPASPDLAARSPGIFRRSIGKNLIVNGDSSSPSNHSKKSGRSRSASVKLRGSKTGNDENSIQMPMAPITPTKSPGKKLGGRKILEVLQRSFRREDSKGEKLGILDDDNDDIDNNDFNDNDEYDDDNDNSNSCRKDILESKLHDSSPITA